MSTSADGRKQEHLKNQAISPYRISGQVEISYFGNQALTFVRLVGACGQTLDEFWAPAADTRPMLEEIVRIRRGQRK